MCVTKLYYFIMAESLETKAKFAIHRSCNNNTESIGVSRALDNLSARNLKLFISTVRGNAFSAFRQFKKSDSK